MSQRGGSVFAHIRFGEKVYSPTISEGEADILFSLEEMETIRWLNYASTSSLVITLRTRIKPVMVEEYPEGIEKELRKQCSNFQFLEQDKLRTEIGNAKFFNVALLGVLSSHIDFKEEAWKRAIKERVPEGFFKENWDAFHIGKKYA
jgi:indolepyruvate ferredoxin oxidoreductase beta subunit